MARPTLPPLRITNFRGINKAVSATEIADNETPDMLNMHMTNGTPDSRTGYERVFSTSLGTGKVNGLYPYRKSDGTTVKLIHHGTTLYTQAGSAQPVSIYTSMNNAQSRAFDFGGKKYILDGANYLVYDGTTVSAVTPYIPTITIQGDTVQGRTTNEDFNLIGAGFKETFSGDGTNKIFQLSLKALDATPVVVKVDGVTKTLTTDYTVDAINGKITFITAPVSGTNNVEITAYKTFDTEFQDYFNGNGTNKEFQLSRTELDSAPITASVDGGTTFNKVEGTDFTVDRVKGKVTFTTAPVTGTNNVVIRASKAWGNLPSRIKKCRFYAIYGGTNDTRVFVSGNPDSPAEWWRCGVNDPSYFPENGNYKQGNSAVTAFTKHYDTMVVLKEPAPGQTTIWSQTFTFNNGIASFPVKPVNDQIGCIATDSVQIIDNSPVFLHSTGVYKIQSSTVRDERNTVPISEKIDPDLLQEPNLKNAVSFDYDRKYWLFTGNKVFVLDYSRKDEYDPHGIWYIYDNIHASYFLEMDGNLYFGSDSQGLLYRFKKETEELPYNDDGAAINKYWKSKQLTFGADERKKMVERVFFTLQPYTKTSADLYYATNKKQMKFVATKRMSLFVYSLFKYSTFAYSANTYPQQVGKKIKAKKITHFQVRFQNNRLNERMNIGSIALKFIFQSEVK